MDFDDDDEFALPSQPQPRKKFLPKSIKPKIEPKPESESHLAPPLPKPEPQEFTNKVAEQHGQRTQEDASHPSVSAGISDMAVDGEVPDTNSMDVDTVEEDYVVREIDVFFNPQVDTSSQLYVMQYPLRPIWRPYDLEERCDEVRVKPKCAEVEIDLSIDPESNNYDVDCEDDVRMTKQTLYSTYKPDCKTSYAIGCLKGNKLHLNPIQAIVQLRPSMSHLKSAQSMRKNSDDPDTKKKNPTTSSEQDEDGQESWVPLKFHGSKSDFSYNYLQKMVTEDSSPIHFPMNPCDYVKLVCHSPSTNMIRPKDLLKRFDSLPLEERLKKWLCEGVAPVHRFSVLKHLAHDVPDEDVLRILKEHALLVQGLWVPKSHLVLTEYPNQQPLRDFVLLKFSKSPTVSRRQLEEKPLKALKVFLDAYAVERHKLNDYKFKWVTDMQFLKLYPDIVKEQQEFWEHIEKRICKMPSTKSSIPGPSQSFNKNARRVEDEFRTSKTMSDETRAALPKVLAEIFKDHPVCSFNFLCQSLQKFAMNPKPKNPSRMYIAASYGVGAPRPELEAVINQVAVNVHGVYVAKSSPQYPAYNAFREVVISLLNAGGGSKAKLKKADIDKAAELKLGRAPDRNEYIKVMGELCFSKDSIWSLKSGDGSPN